MPTVTRDLQKGKGVVFDYEAQVTGQQLTSPTSQGDKLMASAIRAHPLLGWRTEDLNKEIEQHGSSHLSYSSSSTNSSTSSRLNVFDLNMSETNSTKIGVRKKPGKNKRKSKANEGQRDNIKISLQDGVLIGYVEKRKAVEQMGGVPKAVKQTTQKTVPKEGLSKE